MHWSSENPILLLAFPPWQQLPPRGCWSGCISLAVVSHLWITARCACEWSRLGVSVSSLRPGLWGQRGSSACRWSKEYRRENHALLHGSKAAPVMGVGSQECDGWGAHHLVDPPVTFRGNQRSSRCLFMPCP